MGKDEGCSCIALFCAECNCLMCKSPCIAGNVKVCCCNLRVQTECPMISCEGAGCYTAEQGCCEGIVKLCCLYVEVQLPPSTRDIGLGCCGAKCCVKSSGRELVDGEQYLRMAPEEVP